MKPTIPITSEQYVSMLEDPERQALGITYVKGDDDGVMIIDDGRSQSLSSEQRV